MIYLDFVNFGLFQVYPKKYHAPFLRISPKKNPFILDKQLVLCLQRIIVIHIMHNRILYMILIFPRRSYIWSWFFPVTSLYMILILPRHSYIWSWFFPVTVLYMILNLPRHRYHLFRPTRTLQICIPPIFV
jgi:hypothetical protein